jgi:hypothetical protein
MNRDGTTTFKASKRLIPAFKGRPPWLKFTGHSFQRLGGAGCGKKAATRTPCRAISPVLLEAEPDAPAELQGIWRPQDLPASPTPAGGLHWTALGIAVVLVSMAVFSAIGFVLSLGDRSIFLGVASGLALSVGLGLIGYGLAGEWRGFRKLRTVDRLRTTLASDALSVEVLRAAALSWLDQVANTLPDTDGAVRAIRSAATSPCQPASPGCHGYASTSTPSRAPGRGASASPMWD